MTPTNSGAEPIVNLFILFMEFSAIFLLIITPLLTAIMHSKIKKIEKQNKEIKEKLDELLDIQRRQTYSTNYREYRQPDYNNNRNYNQSDRTNNNF